LSVCAGYFHHAGSVDVDDAKLASWWPRKTDEGDERLKLWEAFQTRYAALAAAESARRKAAKERGERPEPNKGKNKLTPADRSVFNALLFKFMNRRDGRCDPSEQGIAEATGLHRATVARSLQRLLAFGFLNWERRRTVMRRGNVWWIGQASNLYRFVKGAMSQSATGTPIQYLTLLGGRLSTGAAWSSRLLFAARHQRREDERRQKMVEDMRKRCPDLF
jgi:predicted transcriptional regulator